MYPLGSYLSARYLDHAGYLYCWADVSLSFLFLGVRDGCVTIVLFVGTVVYTINGRLLGRLISECTSDSYGEGGNGLKR